MSDFSLDLIGTFDTDVHVQASLIHLIGLGQTAISSDLDEDLMRFVHKLTEFTGPCVRFLATTIDEMVISEEFIQDFVLYLNDEIRMDNIRLVVSRGRVVFLFHALMSRDSDENMMQLKQELITITGLYALPGRTRHDGENTIHHFHSETNNCIETIDRILDTDVTDQHHDDAMVIEVRAKFRRINKDTYAADVKSLISCLEKIVSIVDLVWKPVEECVRFDDDGLETDNSGGTLSFNQYTTLFSY